MNKELYPKSYVDVKSINPNWVTDNFLDFMNINSSDLVGKKITSIGGGFGVFEIDAAKSGASVIVVDPIFSDKDSLDAKLKDNIDWLDGKTNWDSNDLVEGIRSKVVERLSNPTMPNKRVEIQEALVRYNERKLEVEEYLRRRRQQIEHLKDWRGHQEVYGMILNPSSGDSIKGIDDNSQDMVVIGHTLSHIHDASGNIRKFLEEGHKLLKDSGKLWIIDYVGYNKEFEEKLKRTEYKDYYKVNKGSFACCFNKKGLNEFLEKDFD